MEKIRKLQVPGKRRLTPECSTRRSVRALLCLGLVLWVCWTFLGCAPAARQRPVAAPPPKGSVAGVVYEDLNRNRVRDPGEPGIAGVRVSNGEAVVLTDALGRYNIPLPEECILFVIKPRDFMTPVDPNGVPRFYYIHKPSGSPDTEFLYKGVPPTGPPPASVDFPLYRRETPEPASFEVIVFSDPQVRDYRELAWFFRNAVAELSGTSAAFGLSLGDLVYDRLELYGALDVVQGLVGIPWYNLPGNHDINFMSPDDKHSDETFERRYGPATYAFQYGPVHFVFLDDVIWKGFTGYRLRDGFPDTHNYEGGLREDQLSFVKNLLATIPGDELVVLAMHIPLEGQGIHRVPQKDRLLRILSGHPHTLSLSGHTHCQHHRFFPLPGGGVHHHYNVGTISGSWYRGPIEDEGVPRATMRDGTPRGYARILFDGTRYTIRYKVSGRPETYRMNVMAPERVTREEAALGVEFLVNVFSGNARSRVEFRVDGAGTWSPMARKLCVDPRYARAAAPGRWGKTNGRALPPPALSTHIWSGRLPSNLARGVHLVEVRVMDMFGRHFHDRCVVLVE
ncbi:MAG: calcineurin-like phosphoesterase family protein [Deltaproteobacteria bacterium]|nr:calcineurin-like phosphoesterase family protein [Deltaproteobacteria bacterium]